LVAAAAAKAPRATLARRDQQAGKLRPFEPSRKHLFQAKQLLSAMVGRGDLIFLFAASSS
jgi:hypothetical protein